MRFKDSADATNLLELSSAMETKLDAERKKKDHLGKNKEKNDNLLSSSSLLKGELELNGRRLVIIP